MPSDKRHVSYKRQYSGEEIAGELVKWLNGRQGYREHSTVVTIIETAWRIQNLESQNQKPRLVLAREALFGEKTELNTVRNRYRKMLKRYAFFPWIGPWSRIAPHRWEPVRDGIDKHGAELPPPGYNDFNAILDLARLADRSLFDRLRRCSCGRWLFARFSHQRFCSAKCREKEFKTSPEWRAHRREWARKNYSTHKRANVK
jgi:hypothetical protein